MQLWIMLIPLVIELIFNWHLALSSLNKVAITMQAFMQILYVTHATSSL